MITKRASAAAVAALLAALLGGCTNKDDTAAPASATSAAPSSVAPTTQPLTELAKLPVDTATEPAPPHRPMWQTDYNLAAYTKATLEFLRAGAINAKLAPSNTVVQYTIYESQQAFDCGNGVMQPQKLSPAMYCPAIKRILVLPVMRDPAFWANNKMAPGDAFYYLVDAMAGYLLGAEHDNRQLLGCHAGLLARESVALDTRHFRETGQRLESFYIGSSSVGPAMQGYATGKCKTGK